MEKLTIEQEYQQMRTMLNEKQWRQYLAAAAKQRGSASLVARQAGVALNTVKRGLKELEAGESYRPGERIRKPGGGKKRLMEADATLLADLEQEVEPKGDPMWRLAVDHEVLGSPGQSALGQRASHQEVCPGRGAPCARVCFTRQQEDHRGQIAGGS
jgi:hypothetical protein